MPFGRHDTSIWLYTGYSQLQNECKHLLQAQAEVADVDAQAPAVVGRSVSVSGRSDILHGHDCPAGWAV